jgi:probable F420-dependent oxidoreductase
MSQRGAVQVKFSVQLPVEEPDLLMACALAIEAAGFDACFVTDHPAPSRVWLEQGGHPTLDPFVALSFAAAATTKLRLHTNCLVPAYRDPLVSAKSIATLDAASRGRVILGVAVGYLEVEFFALGVPYAERAERLDDTLRVMKQAWADQLADTIVLPPPAQRPHPPIWVGGNSAAAMRRVVEHGDGWSPFPASPRMAAAVDTAALGDVASLAHGIRRLNRLAEDAGRTAPLDVCFTPFSLPAHKQAADPATFVADVQELAAVGVTWVAFHVPARGAAEFCDAVGAFGDAVIRQTRV